MDRTGMDVLLTALNEAQMLTGTLRERVAELEALLAREVAE